MVNFGFQIAYQIARSQFRGKLRELFLVLSDDEPRPVPALEARRLSLDPRRDRGSKHPRTSDSSVGSGSGAKRADKTASAEKFKR